ncbi:uncharacterized protein LOC117583417 [Drosophila guanche]|uniref:ZAD domain-containing protein n=1 Tax=Drosophila guanche TaxID=7266 RepID=A0A3B0JFS2_DROGU|nr:uncharacterized protein LOC117583417 [Drosophila guanche]SPP81187.1 Hypothetical predicted protein [Drosophila guanche]
MLNVCRLCLASDATFSIFNGQTALRIMACTAVEVQPNDDLPQSICPACRLRVEEYYAFRKRCHAADRTLRRNKVLQSQDPKGGLLDRLVGAEEESELHDVSDCTTTACSESNAQWRMQTAQLIRTEIDSYKKELLNVCKQEVRAEIEHEVRQEVEELIVEDAKKKCRINVLDDLFYEMERFFSRKRNETLNGSFKGSQSFFSDSETMQLGSITSSNQVMAVEGSDFYESEAQPEAPPIQEEAIQDGNVSIVDLVEDDPDPKTPPNTAPVPVTAPRQILPVTMVEIPMSGSELNHLREDFQPDIFLLSASTTEATKPKHPSVKKVSQQKKKNSPRSKERGILCRKHNKQSDPASVDPANCLRCRLRRGNRLNSTVS